MTTIPSPKFYVYILCRPNGKPFYVGKGTGLRVYKHESEAASGHRCHKCNVIRKIWKEGGQVLRYIVFTTDDESEAYIYERDLIALYNLETLANLSGGNTGPSGVKTETRDRLSAAVKASYNKPGVREAKGRAISAALMQPQVRAKKTAIAKARWARPGQKEHLSTTMKQRYSEPETRTRHHDGLVASWAQRKAEGFSMSAEARASHSAAMKAYHARRKAKAALED